MRKYTLRELKNLVRCGMAHDLTNAPAAEVKEQWKHCEKIGYSSGIYGINGGLIQNTETGDIMQSPPEIQAYFLYFEKGGAQMILILFLILPFAIVASAAGLKL